MALRFSSRRALSILVLGALSPLLACSDSDPAVLKVSISAEALGQESLFEIESTAIEEMGDDFVHEVRVTWLGEENVRLDDARFTHHVESEDGHLITLGRGCGANWDQDAEELFLVCTADLQLIFVESGEDHSYRIAIPREVGPLRLTPGTYVIEENIHWWQQDEINAEPTEEGDFTIRLTYEVK